LVPTPLKTRVARRATQIIPAVCRPVEPGTALTTWSDTTRHPGDETNGHGSYSRGGRKRLAEQVGVMRTYSFGCLLTHQLRRLRHVSLGVAQGLPAPQDWQCQQAQSSVLRLRSRSGIQVDAAPSAVLGVMAVVNSFLQIVGRSLQRTETNRTGTFRRDCS
jgi:hypothetical protein